MQRYVEVKLRIQMLSDAILLEGVPSEVTRVANICDLVPLVFLTFILPRPQFFPLNDISL